MSDAPAAPVAIVAAHGDLAAGLVSAVEAVTGLGARLHPVTNSELGREELEATLEALITQLGARVIFTDLPAGSCALAALRVARGRGEVRVVTGVNLPVLLHFVGHAGEPTAEAQAVERGIAALRLHPEVVRAG